MYLLALRPCISCTNSWSSGHPSKCTTVLQACRLLPQEPQTSRQIATESCGFIAIVIGTFLLHATRDLDITLQNLSQLAQPSAAVHEEAVPLARMPSTAEVQMRRTATPARNTDAGSGWV